MLKLGLTSAILPQDSFEQVIEFAAELGLAAIECCCWPKGKAVRRYAGVTHIDLVHDSDKLEYYRSFAAEKGVAISALGYYPNPMDPDSENRKVAIDHIYRLLEAAPKLGVDTVTTFIGKDRFKTVEENLDLYEEIWTPIIRAAEKQNVRIAIENCPMLYTRDEWPGGNNLASTPYIWDEMFKRIPSPNLGLNYDVSHPYLLFSDYIQPVYDYKDKLFHVHFKDIKIHRHLLDRYGAFSYPSLWHSPKLPGLGGVDFAAFCSALHDIRYNGYATIEVEDRAYEGSPEDVRSGIRQSVRYLKNFLG